MHNFTGINKYSDITENTLNYKEAIIDLFVNYKEAIVDLFVQAILQCYIKVAMGRECSKPNLKL